MLSCSLSFDQRSSPIDVPYCYCDGFLLSDDDDQPLAAGHAGIEQVPLQHGECWGEHRDYDGGIFRALAFVNGDRVGGHQRIELTKSVLPNRPSKLATSSPASELTSSMVPMSPVVNLLFVVILDLHHLVAGQQTSNQTASDLAIAGRIEVPACSSMFNDRGPAPPRFIGRMGSRPNRLGILFDQLDDTGDGGLRILHLHEIEVALSFGRI